MKERKIVLEMNRLGIEHLGSEETSIYRQKLKKKQQLKKAEE